METEEGDGIWDIELEWDDGLGLVTKNFIASCGSFLLPFKTFSASCSFEVIERDSKRSKGFSLSLLLLISFLLLLAAVRLDSITFALASFRFDFLDLCDEFVERLILDGLVTKNISLLPDLTGGDKGRGGFGTLTRGGGFSISLSEDFLSV